MNTSRKAFSVNIIIKIMFINMGSYHLKYGSLKLVTLVQLQSS